MQAINSFHTRAMAMAHLAVTPSPFQQMYTVRKPRSSSTQCSVLNRFSSSPKTGTVGSQRLKENAVPGTYWSNNVELGEEITVLFNKGSETVTAVAKAGENLLKVAERYEVLIPTPDFCFEGSCCHCEMEIVGGAFEVGAHGSQKADELVRSCICPVPSRKGDVEVNLINEDDVWGERVL